MASVGLVLLRVFLRRGIESPEQLEELGINVYASIPVSESFAKRSVQPLKLKKKAEREYESFLAVENPADLAIEAIRGLRTSLHFAMMEARNNVLMISGASPNAGKTFVSSNLAAIIAQTGQKVVEQLDGLFFWRVISKYARPTVDEYVTRQQGAVDFQRFKRVR